MSEIQAFTTEHDDRPLGGLVIDIAPQTVVCQNVTTGQGVTISDPAPLQNCKAAGIVVTPGDRITRRVRGTADEGATIVGGAVTGLRPTSGGCTKLTTPGHVAFTSDGQTFSIQLNEVLAASIAETHRRCYTQRLPLIIAAKQDDTHAPAEAFFRAFSMKSVCMPEC